MIMKKKTMTTTTESTCEPDEEGKGALKWVSEREKLKSESLH